MDGTPTARTATLDDGRTIAWAEYGDPAGAPLVLLHGTPGSRLQFRSMHEPAAAARVRLVCPERPGFGLSDPVPGGATLRGYANDLGQLLDHLGLSTVTLGGASGGGGFAVAVALAHPESIRRLLLVSAAVPAPRSALSGMSTAVRAILWLARHAPWLAGRLLAAQVSVDLDSRVARWGRRAMPPSDRRLFDDPQWRARLQEDFREGLRQGAQAAVGDLVAGQRGIADVQVADLTVDTVLVHGSDDVNVPIGLARWVRSQVPTARLIELSGAGHLSAFEQPAVVLDLVVRNVDTPTAVRKRSTGS
jgi:pimeloyl-ACP methyl ester carboxylesterase